MYICIFINMDIDNISFILYHLVFIHIFINYCIVKYIYIYTYKVIIFSNILSSLDATGATFKLDRYASANA